MGERVKETQKRVRHSFFLYSVERTDIELVGCTEKKKIIKNLSNT